MSSGVVSGGAIAAAVVLPAGVALGAGWIAWQSGKLLWQSGKMLWHGGKLVVEAVDRQVAEKKWQLKEAEIHRKRAAIAVHGQLVEMCTQLLLQVEKDSLAVNVMNSAELESLKIELKDICHESIPEDVLQIEGLNSLGFLKLEKVVAKHRELSNLQIEKENSGGYRGLSLADLMSDVKVAISTMEIQATEGKDISAIDPTILERAKLNEKLSSVTARVMAAKEYVAKMAETYGLFEDSNIGICNYFDGIDEQIETLYMPLTTNIELKKGIKRLESVLEQYDMLIPTIEHDQQKLLMLYQVYVDAAKALDEPIESVKSFKSLKDIEEELARLKARSEKARECAKIYQQLGRTAYLCYAWDQELLALGYSVHTRKEITEMAGYKPQHAQSGEKKIPFYKWNNDDLTQLYSMTAECSLQVIVHDDGTVTMQTISDVGNDETRAVQSKHCSLLRSLYEKLKENWFIIYDYQEIASPDEITSAAEWFDSEDSTWRTNINAVPSVRRKKGKNEPKKLSVGE